MESEPGAYEPPAPATPDGVPPSQLSDGTPVSIINGDHLGPLLPKWEPGCLYWVRYDLPARTGVMRAANMTLVGPSEAEAVERALAVIDMLDLAGAQVFRQDPDGATLRLQGHVRLPGRFEEPDVEMWRRREAGDE